MIEEAEAEDVIYKAESGGVIVEVTAPAGALPDGAELVVERFAKDSDEYNEAADAIDYEDDDESGMAAMDISFYLDGEEVEPSETVKVSIDVSEILPEEADASTIEVQHLVEIETGEEDEEPEIEAVVVANDSVYTEGTIDEENAVAEFEVSSFSTFTVTWDESTGSTEDDMTITVHVYNINGTSIDEELDEYEYYSVDGVINISDLITHLHQNSEYDSIYTFQYATVLYETSSGGGYNLTTIGGEEDTVTSISKSGTSYTVTHGGTNVTVEDPYLITIHLYYSIPTVTLETDNPQEDTVSFTTTSAYFQGETSDATYNWSLTDDSLGTITPGENGTASFAWDTSVAKVGDQVTVMVTMTVGEETASDTYTLTYGNESINFTVYASDGTTPQSNAHVALVDASGNTVATGTTGTDGTVTLYAPAGEYTVGVTYVYEITDQSTSRATAETTITVSDDGTVTGSVTLGKAVVSGPNGDTNGSAGGGDEPYYYEHIDVKVVVASTESESAKFTDLDAVYVYDKYGNLIYWNDDLIENADTTDYNCKFDMGNAEDTHSIVVSSEDTIVLVYEVYEDDEFKTNTIRVNASSLYPEGEYYSYTDVNAWQLCNCIYGTTISKDDWEVAVAEGDAAVEELFRSALGNNYNDYGISITGLSYIQAADYLCDTRGQAGQAGLDITFEVGGISVLNQEYDIQIAKSLQDVPENVGAEDLENFVFTLTELKSVVSGDIDSEIWSMAEDNVAGDPRTGSTVAWTREDDGSWSSIIDFDDFIEYEAEENTVYYYYILGEDDAETAKADVQYYGIKVAISFSSATGLADVTASYCELTQSDEDSNCYIRTSGWSGLTAYTGEDGSTYYAIPFANYYDVSDTIDISGSKTWGVNSESGLPESVTIYLYADGDLVTDEEGNAVTAVATADNGWTWSFTDLPRYTDNDEGEKVEIEYTVQEEFVSGYIPTYGTDEDGNIIITNAIPEVHKYVSDPAFGESTDDLLHEDEADNSDTLEYRLEADHVGGMHSLVLHDLLDDQLDIETLEIKSVTLYTDEGDEGTVLTEGTDYTVTTGECSAECGLDGCSFEIQVLKDVESLSADAYIIVIFDIEVKEGVEDFNESYVDEIDNWVGLSYTVVNVWTGEEIPGYTPPDETATYSYGFGLYKYDEDTNEPLEGAEFVLSKESGEGTVYAVFDASEGTYVLSGWSGSKDDATAIVTGSDGKAVVEGLHDWTFFIEETNAPEGYSQISETITVTITVSEDPESPTITATNAIVSDLELQIGNTPISEDVININGSKTWVGDDENDRPESVTIYLYANGEQVTDEDGEAVFAVATADNDWTWSFTDLPRYAEDGETEIVYTVQEEFVSGYIPTYSEDGLNVTNAIPEVHKYVSDPAFGESTDDLLHEDEADNSDTLEYRLEADHVGGSHNLVLHDLLDDQLDIDTLAVKSVTLYTDEGDEGTILEEGIDYTVTQGECSAECGLDGCSFEIHVIDEDVEGLSADAYIIVIFDIEAIEGAGDFNESYVDEIDNWVGLSYMVYNALTDEYEPGYAPPDKTETYSYGFDLYKYDADSGEPLEGAEFVLSKESGEGTVYAVFDVSEGTYMLSGWTDGKDNATPIVTGSDGKAVVEGLHDGTFFIEETNAPEGYSQISETITVTITVSEDPESPTITATNADVAGLEVQVGNTPVIDETIDITGSKTWVGDDESDRPESVTICLYADGEQVTDEDGNAVTVTTTSDDSWEWTFTDLPKYTVDEDGEISEIEYTVQEEFVSGYIPSYIYGEDGSIAITNAIPEVHKYVSDPAYGESTDDLLHEDEADNSDTLEYRLEADHVGGAHNLVLHDLLDDQLDIDTLAVKSVTLYTGEGDEGTILEEGIDYTVTQGECSAECGLAGCSFEIHVIDEDVEGLSADAYIIVIFDIEAIEGAGDFNESYVDEIDNWVGLSYTVYNAMTGEEEPGYAPPDKTETYSYGFDLYKYDADSGEPLEGAEFVLSKESGEGTVYAVFDVSEGTYMLSGWADSKDGATPIVTGSDGRAVVEGLHDGTFSIEETKAPEGYQQKTGTMTVTITVSEDDPADPVITATNAAVEGLEVQIENTMGETTEVIGSKTWVGDDEDDRPDSITIYLYADGTQIDSVTVTADDDWAWSFSGLPVYQSDGETEIVYTILEGVVSGYIPTYSEDGLNVTNAIPEVHKYVSDPAFGESTDDLLHEDEADNSDTLEYRLEADHVGGAHNLVLHDLLDDQLDIDTLAVKSVTLYTGEGDEGTILEEGIDYTVTQGDCSAECGLDGCSFEIHVIDEDVEGLSADAYIIVIFDIEAIEGAGDFNESYVDEIDNWAGLSYTVYNALTGEEEPGYAPPDKTETYSYGFDLYKYDADSGEPLEGAEFVLSKESGEGTVYAVFDVSEGTYMLSGWTDGKDNATPIVTGSDGKAVVEGLHDGTFFIEETNAPEGYSQISETITVTITVSEDPESPTITATNAIVSDLEVQVGNTPISEDVININGSKTWNDSSDSFGSRPDSITIRLLADGSEVDSATVTADDGWAWSFTDMPKYQEDGTTEISYTITEDAVNNYDTTYDGYNVINTFSPGSTSVTVLKLWDDDNDADGIRPDSITVVLEKNGEATDTTLTLSADNNWEGSFTGLAIYDQEADGSYSSTRNVYSVQEVSVEGYTTEILGDASTRYVIINTHTTNVETGPGPVVGNPDTGGTGSSGTTGAKTSDTSALSLYLLLIMIAGAAIVVLGVCRRTARR